jgi:acetylornithine/succinyldiaminopimelate/putrescine aminotransferase
METLTHDPPLAHVTTFGGHPVCCAAGLASLEVILSERLPQRAQAQGEDFVQQLRALRGQGGFTAVRGRGLLIGMDFNSPEAKSFVQHCFPQASF